MEFNKKENNKLSVLDKIYRLKHGKDVNLTVTFGNVKYILYIISETQIYDQRLIKLLASWRKKHEQWFPAIFPVTLERTKVWLCDRVINEPDRILFMIRVHNQNIGHIGLYRFNFQKNSCEIDNIVRGVDRYPGIMENAIHSMMHWGNSELGVKTYRLSTASDNYKALSFFRGLGFIEAKRIPLIRIVNNDRIEWHKAPKSYIKPIKRYTVVMKLQYE